MSTESHNNIQQVQPIEVNADRIRIVFGSGKKWEGNFSDLERLTEAFNCLTNLVTAEAHNRPDCTAGYMRDAIKIVRNQ